MRHFLILIIFINSSLLAQLPYRVMVPGNTFSVEGLSNNVTVVDASGGGRRFIGKAGATIKLRATLAMPPLTRVAGYKLQKIVAHFSSKTSGPSLRLVEIRNGNQTIFLKKVNLKGDYSTKELVNFESTNNTWVLPDPITVSAQAVIRLEIVFPQCFDSHIDPGEFFLNGVKIDFPGKDIQIRRIDNIKVGDQPIKRKG